MTGKPRKARSGKEVLHLPDTNLGTHLGYLIFRVLTLRVSEFGFHEKMLHICNFVAAAVLSTSNTVKMN